MAGGALAFREGQRQVGVPQGDSAYVDLAVKVGK